MIYCKWENRVRTGDYRQLLNLTILAFTQISLAIFINNKIVDVPIIIYGGKWPMLKNNKPLMYIQFSQPRKYTYMLGVVVCQ